MARPCDKLLPCSGCLKAGKGPKCHYRGGRGGGVASAKHLYKSETSTSSKSPKKQVKGAPAKSKPSASSQTESPSFMSSFASNRARDADGCFLPKTLRPMPKPHPNTILQPVPMVPKNPAARNRPVCLLCRAQHSTCDGKLPCRRCTDRKIAGDCAYRSAYVPAPTELKDSTRESISDYTLNSLPPGVNKIRMVNADPMDTRKVVCNSCTRHHSTCSSTLPCDRCTSRGIPNQCAYVDRYVPADPDLRESRVPKSRNSMSLAKAHGAARTSALKPITQPVTRDITSDSDSDKDEVYADIVHEEEPRYDDEDDDDDDDDDDTIEAQRSQRHSTRDGPSSQPKATDRQKTSSNGKRRASDPVRRPQVGYFDLPPPKRAKLDPEETRFKPSGGARKLPDREDRPNTRLSTSTTNRRSYAMSPPEFYLPATEEKEDGSNELDPVAPNDVPAAIREVFANMPEDVLVKLFPDAPGPGAKMLSGLGIKRKLDGDYSMHPISVSNRERRAQMSILELMLELRENNDKDTLRRHMRSLKNNPSVGWNRLTAAEQEELKDRKRGELARQRDEEGRSANFYVSQMLNLAVGCVGEKAMLQFLLTSRKARLKVIGLFEGLVHLEDDGRLRLLSGGGDGNRDDTEDEEEQEGVEIGS